MCSCVYMFSLQAQHDMEEKKKRGEEFTFKDQLNVVPLLMGKAAGAVTEIKPAKEIMDEMMAGAIASIRSNNSLIAKL